MTCRLVLLVFVFSSSVSIYGYGTLVSHSMTKSLSTVIICSLCAVALIVLMRDVLTAALLLCEILIRVTTIA